MFGSTDNGKSTVGRMTMPSLFGVGGTNPVVGAGVGIGGVVVAATEGAMDGKLEGNVDSRSVVEALLGETVGGTVSGGAVPGGAVPGRAVSWGIVGGCELGTDGSLNR